MAEELPPKLIVSIVIPMYNESESIEKCIASILAQDYPQQLIEIVVVDGNSDDGSKEKVLDLTNKYSNIRLFENPQRRTPRSLNIGIKNSQGDVIIILGAHTRLKNDFVRQNILHMDKMNVKCTGGTQINVGDTYTQQAIGHAMGSIFGIPSAPYRFGKKEQFVDTVVYAAYKKELFDEVGYFDEDLFISEDAELNWRIRQAGNKIFYTPKIVSYYFPRRTIPKLIKQLFRYGILRVNVIKKHVSAVKCIHLVPPLFVLFSAIFLLLSIISPIFGTMLAGVWLFYLTGVCVASLLTAVKSKMKYFVMLPLIFLSIHLSWGVGFIFGLFKTSY